MIATTNSQPIQLCQLCAKRPADTKEHLPTQSAGNIGEVLINYVDAVDDKKGIQSHAIRSSNGFWLPALCGKCNKRTGKRYGSSYADFISEISNSKGITDSDNRSFVSAKGIFPLRIIKQMFSMFLCAVPYKPADKWATLQNFVRRRDDLLPSNAPFVYLYMNTSNTGRIVPCCGIVDLVTHDKMVISEISWPPLGIVFSYQKHTDFDSMQDVTSWGQLTYKYKTDVSLLLPRLQVNTHYPIGFGSINEIESRARVYMFHIPKGSTSPTNMSALVNRVS